MAPPPRIRNITRESLPGAPAWVDPLLLQLNESLSQTVFALSKGLTFSENSQAQLKDISFVAPAPEWTSPTLLNSWVNFGAGYDPIGFRISPGGRVYTRGMAKSGTIGQALLQLPAGYAPTGTQGLPVESNGAHATCTVMSSGTIVASSGSNASFSLSGLHWDAAAPCALPSAPSVLTMVSHNLPSVGGVLPVFCRAETPLAGVSNGAPHVDWEEAASGQVRIKTVHGLQPGVRYNMRLLLFSR